MGNIDFVEVGFCYDGAVDNVFESLSFRIDTEWRLGIVGRNGRGKTTLLRLIAGGLNGTGRISKTVEVDYFPFDTGDASRLGIEIVDEYLGEYEDWRLFRECNLLNLDAECLYRPFCTLSGGERVKLMLAALFLRENNYLLIDEPTNHLDAEARNVVAGYLSKKKGFALVSHDRDFLDGAVDHILALNREGVEIMRGNFSTWFANKEQTDNFERAQNQKLRTEIGRLQASAAQSDDWAAKGHRDSVKVGHEGSGQIAFKEFHRKKAGKLASRAKALNERIAKAVEEKSALLKNIEYAADIDIKPLTHRKERLIAARDFWVEYDGRKAFSPLNFEVLRGERVRITGGNGKGKSSVLRAVVGEVDFCGDIERASGLKISYVFQDTSGIGGTLDEYAESNGLDRTEFRTMLAKLDLDRRHFDKNLSELSAGQKKKVLIVKSLCDRAHLYIYDEPLNFIDIFSRIQIENMLIRANATLIFVEHDAAFSKRMTTKTIEL